jgi:putative protein-disulfide isomerase
VRTAVFLTKLMIRKLIYIMDPQSGWCYGNSYNIAAVYNHFKNICEVEFLVAGMWLGENAPYGGELLTKFLIKHSPSMISGTRVSFSKAYFDSAKKKSNSFSSLEPCAAIVLVKEIDHEKTFSFIEETQKALFVEGKMLDVMETYIAIFKKLKIDEVLFKERWLSEANLAATRTEFALAKSLDRHFPTLLIQDGKETIRLASGYFEKDPMLREVHKLLN